MLETEGTCAATHAEAAYEEVRSINHLTRGPVPAPVAYGILGSLKLLGHALPQTLTQLADGLLASLDTHDVYEESGTDPHLNVTIAAENLRSAARLAAAAAELVELAQAAIARQGYRPTA